MKNKFETAQDFYLNKKKEIKKIEARIQQRTEQIARLTKKEIKLWNESFWGEIFIRPIMEMVKEKYPTIVWDDDRLTPMGLCNRISLFGDTKDGKTIMICFTPSNLKEGIIAYDTEERSGGYPENSIGSWNQMDKVSEDITDINQIYNHIEKQLTSVKL